MQELPCFVCGFVSNIYCKDVKSLRSKHSETSILAYLEKFADHDLSNDIRLNSEAVTCQNCIIKIDEYDELYTNATLLENDLRTILLRTLKKQKEVDEDDSWTSPEDLEDVAENVVDRIQCKPKTFPSMFCNICKRNFESFTELRNHQHIPKKLPIKTAIKKIPPVPGTFINYNTTTMIQKQPKFEQMSKGISTLKCSVCGSTFIDKVAIKEHYKGCHHSDQTRCDICGGLYAKERLKQHRDRHQNTNPLECVDCKKVFKTRSPLARHMATHTLERFFVCELCGKQFTHHSSFKMHMMAHDDVREKKCDECGHLFRSASHLNRHKRVHTNEKPYECLICHRLFAQRYNMMSHLKSHNKEKKLHICTVCEKSFATVHKLKDHCDTAHFDISES